MDEAKKVAEWLGLSLEQVIELKHRLDLLRKEETGFGTIKIDVRRHVAYRISHIVDGKPIVFKEGD